VGESLGGKVFVSHIKEMTEIHTNLSVLKQDTNLFEKTDVEMENEDIDDGENEYNGS